MDARNPHYKIALTKLPAPAYTLQIFETAKVILLGFSELFETSTITAKLSTAKTLCENKF